MTVQNCHTILDTMRTDTTQQQPGCPHGPTTAKAEHEDTPIYTGWTVNADWSGAHEFDARRGGYQCQDPTWRVEICRSKSEAETIAANGDAITEALREAGINHARLTIKLYARETTRIIEISDYDWNAWTPIRIEVPA